MASQPANWHSQTRQSRAITFLLKALSINIVLVFTINTNSVHVSYTYNHCTINHVEYIAVGYTKSGKQVHTILRGVGDMNLTSTR